MGLFGKRKTRVVTRLDRSVAELPYNEQREAINEVATMNRVLDKFVELVGEGKHQAHLERVGGAAGDRGRHRSLVLAVVEPEPSNPYDPGAIRVTIDGEMVGYVQRPDQDKVRPLMEEATARTGVATCRADLIGGWDRGGGDVGTIGVVLDLRHPDVVAKSQRK